jgi:hypothetical protein
MLKQKLFRILNSIINPFGILISKPEIIHGSPAFSGATLFSRKVHIFRFFYDKILNVDGCVIESGVHWGYGILAHIFYTQKGGGYPSRNIIGFDSFEGHSAPNEKDKSGGSYINLGSSFKIYQNDVWKTLLYGTGFDLEMLQANIKLISGWLQDTMPVFKANPRNEPIALVHCDVDIYEPFLITLQNTWDLLSVKGIIILGKMNNPELMGKTEAVNEFIEDLPYGSYKLDSHTILEINTLKPIKLSYLIKLIA